jgi:hypothetical protein
MQTTSNEQHNHRFAFRQNRGIAADIDTYSYYRRIINITIIYDIDIRFWVMNNL